MKYPSPSFTHLENLNPKAEETIPVISTQLAFPLDGPSLVEKASGFLCEVATFIGSDGVGKFATKVLLSITSCSPKDSPTNRANFSS